MNIKNFLNLFIGVLETIVAGGILYGWSSLNYILTIEGYFNASCNTTMMQLNQTSPKTLCAPQQYNLQLILTLGMTISLSFLAVSGVIMDRLGTWTVRSICSLMFILSCLAIAFSKPSISWILYPSAAFMSAGGFGLFVATCQSANLFPNFRGLIINLLNACSEVSIAMLTIVKILYEQYDISLKVSFIFLAFLGVLFFIRTFFLTAKVRIPFSVPAGYYYGIKECCSDYSQTNDDSEATQLIKKSDDGDENKCANSDEKTDVEATLENENVKENAPDDLKSCVFNSMYLLGVFSISVQLLRLNFFVEELNSWLYHLLDGDLSAYSSYLNAFGFIQFGALLMAPVSGLLFDFLLSYFSKKPSMTTHQAKLKAQATVCFLASTTTITYSLLTLIPVPELQYITFVLFVWSDVMFLSNIVLLAINFFPMRHFGTMYGIAVFIGAVFSLWQYLLLYAAIHYFNSDFFVVNLIVFILVLMSLAHPINLYRLSRK